MAQLNDQLTHCAVGCIQDDTVPWLQSQNTSIGREFGYDTEYFVNNNQLVCMQGQVTLVCCHKYHCDKQSQGRRHIHVVLM